MDEFIAQFVGQRINEVAQNGSLNILFDGGGSLLVNNKVQFKMCFEQELTKGLILRKVSREGQKVKMTFDGLSLVFSDAEPDNFDPEVAVVKYPDGRIFVSYGED